MRALLFALAMLAFAGPAKAFSEADRADVRAIIQEQLGAFGRDDATTAYSFASPALKQRFPTEDIFMELVRQGYPPVYRQKSWAFGELMEEGGVLSQTVDIVDLQGTEWTAVYTLERQPDGTLKITGCYLMKKPGVSV